MGSSSVGTYHLLLVLMGAGGEQQAAEAEPEAAMEAQVEGAGEAASLNVSTSPEQSDRGPAMRADLGLLRSLLDVAGVDRAGLEAKLLALAEADQESPQKQDSQTTAARVVAALKSVYQQQAARAGHERDDNAFRQAHKDTARATGPNSDDEYE
ncbi:hypothetical protein HXX76_000989 [Chlamydomonas incerta]|uniref:Uncharacterized protein n=1 Tax=Chlamydomonas incerta TaxID=51695 RepID=A0A835WFN7_CHLIN|nr:hypothetical protein HXX76_000989 [Chlamydomonas incerta]|eukprot:KAG2446404.1 hypothetical protein HXX76_000989 [Chlamydomonas incerta]